ncbi:MAG: M2 family metallopeptidase [Acidobacteriota bacterium]|nr:M2 family metallopeptidase [Acidobacteriota bacterium]
MKRLMLVIGGVMVLASGSFSGLAGSQDAAESTSSAAEEFVRQAEERLLGLWTEAARASWVRSTYITGDTQALAAVASKRAIEATARLAKESSGFETAGLPRELARKLELLRLSLTLAAPPDPKASEELTRLVTSMESTYGKGKVCGEAGDECRNLQDLSRIMASSRDPKALKAAWTGWRGISPPMRRDFQRYVELANQGARSLGFSDTGAMWRAKYDMPPEAFLRELDRLWEQVRPFYLSLHAYVRQRLRTHYGPEVVPADGPIPAHLLGNMWAQTWSNVFPLVAPRETDPGFDLTEILRSRKTTPRQMVSYGEGFFSSLGFAPLPQSFWDRSLFEKPRDREVICHASAWNVDAREDLRIKMCIDITAEDFNVIHHELGHNYYQRAYSQQPVLFRESANDGFHEAVGDTIALSITPPYLVRLGLLDQVPPSSKDLGLLLRQALDKIAFLPFGLLVDQWRWKVFSGEIPPDRYNQAWWELRGKYQGIAPPVARSEDDFDPGAKYHVPANVPYTRYFLAQILQFQFHRALAREAACEDSLHRCSIYGSEAAGKRLRAMLAMGASRPWPEALEVLTGERDMDATAILEYFAPLQKWLDEQNKGQPVGW